MKYRDKNGEWKELYIKAVDTLPIGTEVDFEGEQVPAGWEEVSGTEIIQCGINNDISGEFNPEVKVNLDKQYYKIGDNLTMNNGSIVIGKGIKYVKINVCVSIYISTPSTSKNYCRVRVLKNGANINLLSTRAELTINRPYLSLNGYIVPVKEGDILDVMFYHRNEGSPSNLEYSGFWITVEKVN